MVHATLIAVSQYTKDDVVRTYGRAANDMTVVHHGVNLGQRPEAGGHSTADVRQRYDLPERYILFVGALQPRKNIEGLIAAFEEVIQRTGNREQRTENREQRTGSDGALHLVIVGGGGWKSEAILRRIETSPARKDIHVLRRVPRADLLQVYAHAEMFVLPSFSEGFGMPVLEAMAAGTPVITSNTSSLPEVAGDAALLSNPHNPSDIARAILRILREPALRDELMKSGRARAATFTWDRTAEQTAGVIEKEGQATAANLPFYVKQ
ncbi:MAG: group 1 glycosyl transferase [Parcubacteria group bacterium Gr01-1014_106]|nr:MAG: group 1 glycosyl transferase [Parcubacteria group bacterium Gr01-1014_106]